VGRRRRSGDPALVKRVLSLQLGARDALPGPTFKQVASATGHARGAQQHIGGSGGGASRFTDVSV
jgi:hypothetical protein